MMMVMMLIEVIIEVMIMLMAMVKMMMMAKVVMMLVTMIITIMIIKVKSRFLQFMFARISTIFDTNLNIQIQLDMDCLYKITRY